MIEICRGGKKRVKGQYFLLFGFILLLSVFYYIISFSIPSSFHSLSLRNQQISHAVQLSLFNGFYSSLPSLYTIINEFISGNNHGVIILYRMKRINNSYYYVKVEMLNYKINFSEVNITLNNASLSLYYRCEEEYCRFNKTIRNEGRDLNITINLKYFMNNELINTSKAVETFHHNVYAYYYAFRKGGDIISEFGIM